PAAAPQLPIGALTLDLQRRAATVGAATVALTPMEYALLEALAMRNGAPVGKDAIMQHLYGVADERHARTVKVLIHNLRAKLIAAGAGDVIVAIRGFGYGVRATARAEAAAPVMLRAA